MITIPNLLFSGMMLISLTCFVVVAEAQEYARYSQCAIRVLYQPFKPLRNGTFTGEQ